MHAFMKSVKMPTSLFASKILNTHAHKHAHTYTHMHTHSHYKIPGVMVDTVHR